MRKIFGDDRRKHKRILGDLPVVCQIGGVRVSGWAVNACNRGMMVRFYIPLRSAIRILARLNRNRSHPVDLEFTHTQMYQAKAEVKHFYLEFTDEGEYRSSIGLLMSKIASKG